MKKSEKQFIPGVYYILGAVCLIQFIPEVTSYALDLSIDGVGSLSAGSSGGSLAAGDKAVGMLGQLTKYYWAVLTPIAVIALSITGYSAFVSKRPDAMKNFFMVCVGIALAFASPAIVSFLRGLANLMGN